MSDMVDRLNAAPDGADDYYGQSMNGRGPGGRSQVAGFDPPDPVKLVAATHRPPPGQRELLVDLGDAENGFGGTPVHTGDATVPEYLRQL